MHEDPTKHDAAHWLDRRGWLTSLGVALGGLGMSRLLAAGDSSRSAIQPRAGSLARLSLNENPFGPSPEVVAALARQVPDLCRYTGAEFYDLVAAIAAKERIAPNQVILGEILEPLGRHLSARGGPGGEFIYSDPGYTALIDAAAAIGGRAVAVPLNSRVENDLPGLAGKVTARTRAVYLVNPHNPTGIVSGADELRDFAHRVGRRALVIVDEAYLEFADQFSRRTLSDLVRAGENVVVIRTFAKIYGLAGLDIGYALVPSSLARALVAQGANDPHSLNRLAIAAAIASLHDTSYVRRVSAEVEAERQQWFALFRQLGVRFTPSVANFVFFETGIAHQEFSAALIEEGVAIARAFPPYDRWARISIGLPHENALARAAVRKILRA
jgi:histidinol-phosphate aminotransferase